MNLFFKKKYWKTKYLKKISLGLFCYTFLDQKSSKCEHSNVIFVCQTIVYVTGGYCYLKAQILSISRLNLIHIKILLAFNILMFFIRVLKTYKNK